MFTRLYALFFLLCCISTTGHANDIDQRQQKRLHATIMNSNIPLEKRVEALKVFYADQLVNGKIVRKFCVWDILGKAGPVYATVADQQFRSMHYGLEFSIDVYQDEDAMINDLKNGTCDAALMSGARALEFNRFAGSIEALGAVPALTHLHTLFTVMSSPKMAERMQEGAYTVLGVASLGENYLYTASSNIVSLQQLVGRKLGVPNYDESLQALAQRYGVEIQSDRLLKVVDRYVQGEDAAMLAPIVGYHIGGSGKIKPGMGIVNIPLSQSTIHLIGRTEQFPQGVAQILREDFLLKFENYVSRVEAERATIAEDKWFYASPETQKHLEQELRETRISLLNQGVYDATMIKLAKKVRCRGETETLECQDGRE